MKYRETEGAKVRRLGFALDEATLKQLAYRKGITQTYESMTQAQKAQLRYVAMIEQAKNIGVTGDMSRTIDTASNGVRVLEARIQQFTRALGNMLMPVLSALLPYFTAFVQVLTEAANGIANFLGFELPKIDLSGVSNGYDDIAGAADSATAATEKFKGSLAGVDQLNIIGSHTDKSGSGTGYSTDLDIELPTYDFLNGVESKTKEIAENIRKWFKEALPWIEAVGTAIATAFVGTKVVTFITNLRRVGSVLKTLTSQIGEKGASKLFGALGGLAAGATSGVLLYNPLKRLVKGTGDLTNNWLQLAAGIGIAGGAIAAFIALGNPVGAVITLVGSLTGAMIGCTTAVRELTDETYKSVFYSNVGTSIQDIADKYSAWADEITKTDDKVAQNQQAIEANKKTIEDSLGTLDDLAKSFEASGNMSEEAAGKIKEASESMSNAISSNLTTELNNVILGIGDSWDTVAEKAGLAKDEILNALYAENNQGNEALTALEKQMSESSRILATAKKGTAEYNQALDNYNFAQEKYNKVAIASLGADSQDIDYKLSSLTADKIALMDEKTARSAIAQIQDSYNSAVEKMSSTKNSALSSQKIRQAQLEALDVDTNSSINEGLLKGIETEYERRVNELSNQTLDVVNMLEQRVKNSSSDAGTQALQDLYNRANKSIYDGAKNFGDVITNAANQAGATLTYAGAWWRTAFGGGKDVNQTLRDDYEQRNGVSDIKSDIENLKSDIEATVTTNVSREMKSQSPAVSVGYAREAVSSAYSEAAANRAEEATPIENNVYVSVELDGEEISNTTNRVQARQYAMSNGR